MVPSAPITNAYLICSHSHIFGLQSIRLQQSDDGKIAVDLQVRACKLGDINIKFLVRYEVKDR